MSQPTQIINLFSKQPIVVGVLVQIIYISNLRSHAPLFGNYLFQHSKQLFCKWLPYHYKSVLFQFVVGNARTSLLCIMAQCLNTFYKEMQIAVTNEDEELQINWIYCRTAGILNLELCNVCNIYLHIMGLIITLEYLNTYCYFVLS